MPSRCYASSSRDYWSGIVQRDNFCWGRREPDGVRRPGHAQTPALRSEIPSSEIMPSEISGRYTRFDRVRCSDGTALTG